MKKLVRIRGLCEALGFGKSKIYEMIKRGEFPAGTMIGGVRVWDTATVDAWITERLNGGEAA